MRKKLLECIRSNISDNDTILGIRRLQNLHRLWISRNFCPYQRTSQI